VRLVGYVLIELAAGVGLAAGASGAIYFGSRAVATATAAYAASAPTPASAPSNSSGTRAAPTQLERPHAELGVARSSTYFIGVRDEVLLEPLRRAQLARVKFNRGGSSISLRLDFVGGFRASFKPDQTNEQTVPRKEIAAYRINRLIGLETVSPSIGRRFEVKELVDKMEEASKDLLPRFHAQTITDGGMVNGEVQWWIPVIVDAKIDEVNIDSPDGMTSWHKLLQHGVEEPPSAKLLLPQISTMVAFDYLINNTDRWSGSNAKTGPDGKMLFFMDNTFSFGTVLEGSPKVRAALEHVQKFSRSMVRRVRGLAEAELREAMLRDAAPYERLLTESEIAGVLYRRDTFLGYVDSLITQFGEGEVLVYP